MVLSAAEAKNQKENKRKQKEANPEACAFAEALRKIDDKNDQDNEVHERN